MTDAPRTESEGFYEMLWDCNHCGAKDLLGKSQRHCPECGAPQDDSTRHFPKEGEAKEVAGHKYEGTDRRCPACDTPQGATGKNCGHCGAPMDGSKAVPVVPSKPPPVAKKSSLKGILIAVAVVLGLGTLIYMRCIRSVSASLTVAAHRWERTVAIEEYQLAHEEAWRDQLPATAQVGMCTPKPHSTRKVPDGETCTSEKHDKGDGTFEKVKKCVPKYRSESVDADYCTYTIQKWKEVDKARSSGTGQSPTWPATPALPPTTDRPPVGTRRIGAKTEKLMLDFKDASRTQSCDVENATTWAKYVDGKAAKVEVRAASGDLVCKSL